MQKFLLNPIKMIIGPILHFLLYIYVQFHHRTTGEIVFLLTHSRQSKLSQEQLSELQRSTHFDKKELQQWYKGKSHFPFHVPQSDLA